MILKRNYASGFNFNNCLQFDGVDDYVNITGGTQSAACCLSWWTRDNSLNTAAFGESTNSAGYHGLLANSTTLRFRTALGTNNNFTINPQIAGVWYHYYMERDSANNMRLFQNGVESSSGTLNTTIGQMNLDVLGRRTSGSLYFDGRLNEVCWRIGTPPANPATVAAGIYNGGNGADPTTFITSPTYYLKLNESGTDTIAFDSSGNGNNGTLTNFPASGMWVDHFAP